MSKQGQPPPNFFPNAQPGGYPNFMGAQASAQGFTPGFSQMPRAQMPVGQQHMFSQGATFNYTSSLTQAQQQQSHIPMQPQTAIVPGNKKSARPTEEITSDDPPVGTLTSDYDEKVRPMIDVVDRLRHLGLDKDVDLPSIVVVGDQSAGKSSVLEAISGVELPRGADIVTRCPLELRLKKNVEVEWEGRIMYKETTDDLFSHEEVEAKVREAQEIITGTKKGISNELIHLQVEGPDMPDLTLVDLPGITRVAVSGQDPAVSQQIQSMISRYIEKENTIILAVAPANVDIATSEALQMAERVDPKGERTLGVITKTDLLPHGEEFKLQAILENQSYKLKKGFVAVRCRDQKAIKNKLTLQKALQDEDTFFQGSQFRDHMVHGQCGIRALSSNLAGELAGHIQKTLPSLAQTICTKLEETRDRVATMGEGLPDDNAEKMRYLNQLLHDYTDDLQKLADGHEGAIGVEIRLHNMAKKNYEVFAGEIQKKVPQKRGTKTNQVYQEFITYIKGAIDDDTGRELPFFMKFDTFKRLTWRIVDQFKDPANKCFASVIDEVQKRLEILAKQKFHKYPKLESKIKGVVGAVIRNLREKGSAALMELFELEKIVFSQAQTYTQAVSTVMADKGVSDAHLTTGLRSAGFANPDGYKVTEAEGMFTRIQAYLEICVLRIADIVPMIVTRHAILRVIEDLRRKVNDLVSPEHRVVETLDENPDEKRERQKLKARLNRLENAKCELDMLY